MSKNVEQSHSTDTDLLASDVKGSSPMATYDRRVFLEVAEMGRTMGNVQMVRAALKHPDVKILLDAFPDAAEEIAKLQVWADQAVEHEKVCGKGSLIDRMNPIWLRNQATLKEWSERQKA